ncbi:MAG: GTPase domain-containing protein [Succinivibrionaceae bacterium]|nr:GTPase domain-containing protein [Succinivibrionaceae bacterium]
MGAYRTNVLLLGKSGVGKSSLLNYLFGDAVARVGGGRPVTGMGLHEYPPFGYHGLEIHVTDSWGLEPDKGGDWRQLVERAIAEHDAREVKDWFHSVIYCVDATVSRLDDYEINQVLRPLVDSGNQLLFALTKSDKAPPGKVEALSKALSEGFPGASQVRVGSTAETLMGGRTTSCFGREELLTKVCKNLCRNLVYKYSQLLYKGMAGLCRKCHRDSLARFEEMAGTLGIFTVYGDDFRDTLLGDSRGLYERACTDLARRFMNDLSFIDRMAREVLRAVGAEVPLGISEGEYALAFSADSFREWRNDASAYFSAAIRSVVFPLSSVTRKSRYRDEFELFLKHVDATLKDHVRRHCEPLCRQVGVEFRPDALGAALSRFFAGLGK